MKSEGTERRDSAPNIIPGVAINRTNLHASGIIAFGLAEEKQDQRTGTINEEKETGNF